MTHDDPQTAGHIWRFFRAGGFDQVRLETGADIANLASLDQKLWVALACPTRGLEFDEKTLDLIDTDQDGRIRAPELLAAAQWAVSLLKVPDDLTKGRSSLALDAFAVDTPDGARLLASARTILNLLGRPDAMVITLEDTADIEHIFDGSTLNGDGVVPADAAASPELAAVIADVIATMGPVSDRGGKPGVSKATVDRFFAEAAAYRDWHYQRADQPLGPLGEKAAEAAVLLHGIATKIDDYFTRCGLVAFDPGAAVGLNPDPALYAGLGTVEIQADAAALAALPIARIEAGKPLPLIEGINPAWAVAVMQLRATLVLPILGAMDDLSEANWKRLKDGFAQWQCWVANEPDTLLKTLGIARISAILDMDAKTGIDSLLAQDAALAPEIDAISDVDKLIRLQRDLFPLLNNVVAFRDFYTRAGKAVFQAGTLYLDGRSLDLCVRVEDEAKHSQIASLGGIFIVYCKCARKGETMTIAAAITGGDSDSIRVGRNCVFYDRKGQDWDATITKIIEHPISLRQAFWLPYKQAARAVSDAIQKLAAARQASVKQDALQKAFEKTVAGDPVAVSATAPKEAPFDAGKFAGILAAVGLAFGALATAVATIVTGFLHLPAWQMPLVLVGLMLAVSGPSLIIASFKLAARNLGPILDASGWAVNARLKINIPFGTALTTLAKLPPGAQRSLNDPFAEEQRPWGFYLLIAGLAAGVLVAWRLGLIALLFGS